ncbi:MAG: sigma-70 family RNA polymerase sigma factor, partial [Clostridia bacterium]|nr:sigma-70 family RNA polymerase sigma factor [Clostridia bacterium]
EVPPDIILQKNRYVFEELSTCIPAGTKLTEDELTLILNSFLNGLSRNETKFFVRRYYSLLSVADIASETGIKENHVRSRLAKIRKKLTKFIKEWK